LAPLVTGMNTTDGGLAPPALKNENGAKFATPSFDIEETNAIGRGTTQAVKSE